MTQYSGVFTLQQQGQALTSGQWCTDPYYRNTTLLLHADGVSGGAQNNTFIDSSTNNFAITRNGNTTQGSFTPYGPTWSNYFDGSSNIYSGSNAAFGFGTGDFTVEFWLFLSAAPASGSKYTLVDFRPVSTTTPHTMYVTNSAGTLYLGFYNGTTDVTSSSQPVTANTWVHCAYSRASGTLKIYTNGNEAYSAANTVDYQSTRTLTLGTSVTVSEGAIGYFSNFRITKGAGLYTTAFTPSTVPLTTTVSSGTVTLLTCQGNRFVDASGTVTLSLTSTPSVQRFSPFAPQYQYTPAVIGGSGYFDGSDYLSVANNSALSISGSVDACIDCWVYPTSAGCIVDKSGVSGSVYANYAVTVNSNGSVSFFVGNSGSPGSAVNTCTTDAGTIQFNAWNHVVCTKNYVGGGPVNIYRVMINGVLRNNNSQNNPSDGNPGAFTVGHEPSTPSDYLTGYVMGIRVFNNTIPTAYQTASTTNGTSIYTVPSAPSETTSASIYLGFTNAGIYDNAMMNDLETVGNAQVSTSVVKYGSGSLAFDGTGDALSLVNNSWMKFGTGDFTIEAWIYPTVTGDRRFVSIYDDTDNQFLFRLNNSTNTVAFNIITGASSIVNLTSSFGVSLNTWTHVAAVRSGSSFVVYINGVSATSGSSSSSFPAYTSKMWVSTYDGTNEPFYGYIDDLRITKGVARYTANFIPPKVAFANQ